MRIDASALKSNYGALGSLENGSPLLGGSRTSGVRATRLNVSASSVNTADQFADLIASKTVLPKNTSEIQEGAAENGQTSKDPSELADALANAADFIESKFGHDAATAFKGIVISNSGDQINEDSLGNGLLKSIQFIDRNFGFTAGDQVMDHFNSNLNNAMNDYFENGLQEHFFATSPGATAKITLQNTFAQVSQEFGQEAAKNIESLIEQVLEEKGNSLDSLKEGLEKGLTEAEKLTPGITDMTAPLAAGEIMDTLQGSASITPPAPGSVLNLAV